MTYEQKALKKETINRLLSSKEVGRFSWLSTKNRRLILAAIDANEDTVELDRAKRWSTFSISIRDDNKIYISPSGVGAPFTPTAWLDLEKLREELE